MSASSVDLAIDDDYPYSQWLERLNWLCIRFLDIELESFPIRGGHNMRQYYVDDAPPGHYFTEVILPELRAECGIDFIDGAIARNCKNGTGGERPRI